MHFAEIFCTSQKNVKLFLRKNRALKTSYAKGKSTSRYFLKTIFKKLKNKRCFLTSCESFKKMIEKV